MMAAVIWVAQRVLDSIWPQEGLIALTAHVALPVLVGAAAYWGAAVMQRSEEAALLSDAFLRRLRQLFRSGG